MSVSFSHAWGIVGIAGAAAVLGMLAWAAGWIRRGGRGVVLPALAGVAMALAVAGPVVRYGRRATQVVILLDLSGSTRGSPWRDPRWVREVAQRRLGDEGVVSVVGFAGTTRVLMDHVAVGDGARWPTEWPVMEGESVTDVAGALAWRFEEEAGGGVAPRWVMTDGLVAWPDGAAWGPLGVTEISPGRGQVDVGVVDLRRVGSGELDVQVRATGPAGAELEVRRDGQVFARQALRFSEAGGSTRWVVVHDAEAAGPHRYEVTVARTPTADLWPENDRASLLWSPPAAPRVLAAGKGEVIPSSVRELLALDRQVVVLDAGAMLSAQQLGTVNAFVRETGGGLLLNEMNGPPIGEEGVLEQLSPVLNAAPDRAAARVVFLVDASGSMNEAGGGVGGVDQKFRLAARAVAGAVALLHADDQLTVLTFNDGVERIGAGTKAESGAGLEERLLRVQPTGPTSPDAALAEVAKAFANKPADAPGMLVLLTDGEIPSMEVGKWEAMLRSTGASLAIIAPPASHRDALSELAEKVSATWYATADATRWAMLLRRAVAERFAGRERTERVEWQSENLEPALHGDTARWQEVWRKSESLEVVRAGKTTLAAVAQRGLGKVGAVAMDDASAAGQALLERMVERLAPPAGDRRITLSSTHEGNHWSLVADAIDGGQFMNGLSLHATIVGIGAPRDVVLDAKGPGRYEARLESSHPFEAIVAERGDGRADHFVGRLQVAQVEVGEWPASVEAGSAMKVPQGAVVLGAADGGRAWSPRVESAPFALAPLLWGIGIVLLMMRLLVGWSG